MTRVNMSKFELELRIKKNLPVTGPVVTAPQSQAKPISDCKSSEAMCMISAMINVGVNVAKMSGLSDQFLTNRKVPKTISTISLYHLHKFLQQLIDFSSLKRSETLPVAKPTPRPMHRTNTSRSSIST